MAARYGWTPNETPEREEHSTSGPVRARGAKGDAAVTRPDTRDRRLQAGTGSHESEQVGTDALADRPVQAVPDLGGV